MRRTCLLIIAYTLCLAGCASRQAIRPAAELPATTPWNLAELSRPPAFEWLDRTGPVYSLLYEGEPYQGRPTRIFAYYATPGTLRGEPSRDRQLPAIVLIHGGGGTAFREWAELWAKRGYAAIAMDLAGSRPIEGLNAHDPKNREPLPEGGPGQGHDMKFGTIDLPATENWCYHAVAAAIRAHSLIRSFPQVDASRTAVTGISWGGYLTCIVASLDNRFGAAVPVYGCGFLHENSAWLDEFARMGPERAAKWVSLYDPSRYLPACRVPIFFVNGTNDFAYPLDSYMKSYNAVRHAPKNIRVTVNMPHSHPAGWEPKEIETFVNARVRTRKRGLLGTPYSPSLPKVRVARTSEDRWRAEFDRNSWIQTITLHYTVETTAINERQWRDTALGEPGSRVEAAEFDIPRDATAWFVTVTDSHGATVSSPVHFP